MNMIKFIKNKCDCSKKQAGERFENRISCLLLTLVSGLIPLILYLHLTVQNRALLPFWSDFVNPVCIGVLCSGIFLTGRWLFQNNLLAVLLSQLLTLFFYTYRFYNSLVLHCLTVGVTTLYLILFTLFGVILILCFRKWRFELSHKGSVFVACAIFLLFLFQCASFLNLHFQQNSCVDERFVHSPKVSSSLPSPNIYWIHCDGFLGIHSFQKYFHDSQDSFRNELRKKSFFIYDSAYLTASCSTKVAVTALMNPEFYDRFLIHHVQPERKDSWRFKNENLLAFYRLVANQFYLAFEKKRFQVVTQPKDCWSFSYIERFSSMNEYYDVYLQTKSVDIFGYIARWMPNSFFVKNKEYLKTFSVDRNNCPDVDEDYIQNNLPYIHAIQNLPIPDHPTLTIIKCFAAHVPYAYDETGKLLNTFPDYSDPEDYKGQHLLTTRVLLWTVENILEKDPDAVIVLQADHGLHCTTERQFREYFGEKCNPHELWNQVFSAVRIPKKFRNGEEKYMAQTPLNIVRYLINSFVGPGNCSYIKPE